MCHGDVSADTRRGKYYLTYNWNNSKFVYRVIMPEPK